MNGSRWPVASRDDDFAPYLDGRPEAEKFTKTLTYHGYLATAPSDLDDEFAQWLSEARAVGDGAHLTSGAP